MSKLIDFLYADTGVVKNKENCHDANILARYSETALMTSLPLLNSLKLNLKNLKDLHKQIFGNLFETAGKTKDDLEIEDSSIGDIKELGKELFTKKWLKNETNTKDLKPFAESMSDFLIECNKEEPFLYGSLDVYLTFANYVAKCTGIDIDFNKLSELKENVKDGNRVVSTDLILRAMQPLNLIETNKYREHFNLKKLDKVELMFQDENGNGFTLESKGLSTEKTLYTNGKPTNKYVSLVSEEADATVALISFVKDNSANGWKKTDKIINTGDKEIKEIYELNNQGEEEVGTTIVEENDTVQEFNHHNGIRINQYKNYPDAVVWTNFAGNEIIKTSPNILRDLDKKSLITLTKGGKDLDALKDKLIIQQINDNKFATITDVRVNQGDFEAIINYDNHNYLVSDLGERKGIFDYYKLDNEINDSTFVDHDRHESYTVDESNGMEMD